MKRSMWACAIAVAAMAFGVEGSRAIAQQPQQPQHQGYYGYPSSQAPSPQGPNYTCYPNPPACYPAPRVGCNITICPCPCSSSGWNLGNIPPIRTPSCYNAPTVYSELPPNEYTIPIYRNCYVPIKIQTTPSRYPGVNLQVKWREVHVVCDAAGNPLNDQQVQDLIRKLEGQYGMAAPQGQFPEGQAPQGQFPQGQGPQGQFPQGQGHVDHSQGAAPQDQGQPGAPPQPQPQPQPDPAAEPPAAPQPAPAPAPGTADLTTPGTNPAMSQPAHAPVAEPAPANTPAKQWIWLPYEGVYGYGYQRADGYWEIDPNSRRKTL